MGTNAPRAKLGYHEGYCLALPPGEAATLVAEDRGIITIMPLSFV